MNLFRFGLIAAMAAGMALAQPAAPARGAGRQVARHRMMKALDLTDAQKEQARQIFQQARETAKPVAQQLKDNRESLRVAIQANDVAQIQTLSAQQGALHGQMAAIRSAAMAKFYSGLTPEQRARAEQFRSKIQQRRGQRWKSNG
jgi:Spy/CpxP family protein refolding chaperone